MNRKETSERNLKIVQMKKEGYKQTAIAKKFKLTTCQVSRILKKMREEGLYEPEKDEEDFEEFEF